MPDSRLHELYDGVELARPTPHSHATLAALLDDIREIRSRGYALDDQETREGMMCVGAPVFDASGTAAVAAVAVSMVKFPEDAQKSLSITADVQRFARALSRKLGATA